MRTNTGLSGRSDALREALRREASTLALLGVDVAPVGSARTRAAAEAAGAASAAPGGGSIAPAAGTAAESAAATAPRGSVDDERTRRQTMLEELRARHDAGCAHCTRAKSHTRTVFGEGDPCAALMFVGEAPGEEEDRTGRPFVGRAGQKLNEMIAAMGLRREDVYIANVLKARPPNNATPTIEEAERCGVWLREQVAIIGPRVIVALGRPASGYLLGSTESMGAMRGRWREMAGGTGADGRVIPGGTPVMPTFHPAYLLRAYTPENRKKVWSDLQEALARVRAASTTA